MENLSPAQAFARACFRELAADKPAAGYEITPQMIEAGVAALKGSPFRYESYSEYVADIYTAMTAAREKQTADS